MVYEILITKSGPIFLVLDVRTFGEKCAKYLNVYFDTFLKTCSSLFMSNFIAVVYVFISLCSRSTSSVINVEVLLLPTAGVDRSPEAFDLTWSPKTCSAN